MLLFLQSENNMVIPDLFQDRMDMESLQMIEPEFKKQENLVNRKTLVQLANTRTATIFTEGNANWPYGGWGFFSSSTY